MKNKVVIITGGSSGIGKACAEKFGSEGAKVVVTGRNPEKLQETEQWLKNKGIDVLAIIADVSLQEDCKRMVAHTVDRFGTIDILINNAGITMRALFEDADVEVIKKVMDINFYGTVYATKYALPYILKQKGSIVAVSSIAGLRGLPARIGYSSSKFAMQGFMESLRAELLYKGVHVLVACPGFTTSNIRTSALGEDGSVQGESPRDEGKMMTAEEVANHMYKAVVKRKRDIVLTTQGKLTVFMNKWFPGFMDKVVFKVLAKEKDSPLQKA
ncbi:SDR family oxidoreductase [Cytophagaceae bacterium ABcell3]|nr:SDR family oxidoreductase [Cytophagaceae bacterium ABcell3]